MRIPNPLRTDEGDWFIQFDQATEAEARLFAERCEPDFSSIDMQPDAKGVWSGRMLGDDGDKRRVLAFRRALNAMAKGV